MKQRLVWRNGPIPIAVQEGGDFFGDGGADIVAREWSAQAGPFTVVALGEGSVLFAPRREISGYRCSDSACDSQEPSDSCNLWQLTCIHRSAKQTSV